MLRRLQNASKVHTGKFGFCTESVNAVETKTNDLPPNLNLAKNPEKAPVRMAFPNALERIRVNENSVSVPLLRFQDGSEVEEMKLNKSVFGAPLRKDILHRVVKWQLACKRAGTHKTKTRSEVRGSTRKPWNQKGSGRARVGDIRAAQWRGGYTVHGKTPRDYSYSLPKKVRWMGVRVALSEKLREGKLAIVDDLQAADLKTKAMGSMLTQRGWDNALFVQDIGDVNEGFTRSIGNLPHIDLVPHTGAGVYSILKRDIIVLSKNAVNELTQRLAVE